MLTFLLQVLSKVFEAPASLHSDGGVLKRLGASFLRDVHGRLPGSLRVLAPREDPVPSASERAGFARFVPRSHFGITSCCSRSALQPRTLSPNGNDRSDEGEMGGKSPRIGSEKRGKGGKVINCALVFVLCHHHAEPVLSLLPLSLFLSPSLGRSKRERERGQKFFLRGKMAHTSAQFRPLTFPCSSAWSPLFAGKRFFPHRTM